MFLSIPYTPRQVRATEARLQAIYDAAALGLKGDALALAAGMLPGEYRQLCELDPVAEVAAQKGRADAEAKLAKVMHAAALSGDTKAALAILQNRHDWTPKQDISIDIHNRISITQALQAAQERVIEGEVLR